MTVLPRLVTLCVALCAAATVASVNDDYCPSAEWLPYRDSCYWASSFPLEWRSVANVCDLQFPGARPASVHDVEVNAFLAEEVLNFTGGWLGLRHQDEDHEWEWSDGSQYDWQNWEQGEPHGDGERCAYINHGKTGGWRDGDCDISYLHFVCQTGNRPDTTTVPPTTTAAPTTTPTWAPNNNKNNNGFPAPAAQHYALAQP